MRVIFTFVFVSLGVLLLHGQQYEVTYQSRQVLQFSPGPEHRLPPALVKKIRKTISRVQQFKLRYRDGRSVYEFERFVDDGEETAGTIMIHSTVYKDFASGLTYRTPGPMGEEDVMMRDSLMTGWQIQPERDTTIAGFPCRLATYKKDDYTTKAWFAPSIPLMDGPSTYAGLPGLILKVEAPGRVIEAVDVNVIDNAKDARPVEIPKDKKIVEYSEAMKGRFRKGSSIQVIKQD